MGENAQFYRDVLQILKGMSSQLDQVEFMVAEELRRIEGEPRSGLVFSDLLDLSDSPRNIVLEVSRAEEATLAQIVKAIGGDRETIKSQVQTLVQRGYLIESQRAGQKVYRVPMGMRRPRQLPDSIWDALERKIEKEMSMR